MKIDKPEDTIHTDVTFHLRTEQQVLDEAARHGSEPVYLPREGSSASLVYADWGGPDGGRVHVVARIG